MSERQGQLGKGRARSTSGVTEKGAPALVTNPCSVLGEEPTQQEKSAAGREAQGVALCPPTRRCITSLRPRALGRSVWLVVEVVPHQEALGLVQFPVRAQARLWLNPQ